MHEDTIVQIPIDQLHESPFNPRRRFHGIAELAETMRPPNGRVLQALLVRPRVPPLFAGDAELADSAATGFEVVYGHRRRLAGMEAGLTTLPCVVRSMSDAEARHCQVVENLARMDVHPFEEAEGFEALMREDGLSADELAQQFGKSRSYVYGRLKLLQACPQVRDACLDGKIGAEVALLVARLRTPKLQEQALAAIRQDTSTASNLEDGGKRSYRHIRDLLLEKFTLELKSAIFDPEDELLCPLAGSCSTCSKLSGNAPEFEDLAAPTRETEHRHYTRNGGARVCTDPDCFAAKKTAHLARVATQAAREGGTVISGNKAKAAIGADGRLKGYVPLKDVQAALKRAPKGTPAPEVVTIIDQRTGQPVKAVKVADAPASVAPKTADTQRGQQRDWEAERAERQRQADAETAARTRLLHAVRTAAPQRERSADELRIVLAHLLADAWAGDTASVLYSVRGESAMNAPGSFDEAMAYLQDMPTDKMALLLLDVALTADVECAYHSTIERRPQALDAMARLYGMDIEAESAEPGAATASTPSPAGAGAQESEPAAAPLTLPRGVKYHCPLTGQTWTGRGLKPRWVQVALENGKTLADLAVAGQVGEVKDEAGCAGIEGTAAGLLDEAMV